MSPSGASGLAAVLTRPLPVIGTTPRTSGFALPIVGAVLDLTQRPPQRIDLAFIGNFLAFRQLNQLEHFFHLLDRAFERLDDFHDFIDGLMDCRTPFAGVGLTNPFGELLNATQ